ncbi:hypothetical protein [Paenibacillus xylanivorans]|uniref:DUF1453 domain-containing protein n=1 Tax=Paenibacillus xylanivorans TaxID=1705561 RepID=A0A0N0C2J3_9BACL|nr:hypothetical protein [Paenibacillus xylanivorans]KOY12981.1 hypothetical protein AMS66_28530 [Paenibacillus xylanivorans]
MNSATLNVDQRTRGEGEEKNMMNIVIVAVIVLLLSLREKEVKTSRLWVFPAIIAYWVLSSVVNTPLMVGNILLYIVFLIIGCGIGAWRVHLEQLRIHPTTGKMMSKGSLASSLLLIAVMVLRQLASQWDVHHTVVSLSNALLFLPLGSIAARRYFLYAKVQRFQGRCV